MNDSTNTDPLNHSHKDLEVKIMALIPKAGFSQEQIALAFDLWEQRKVEELKQQEQEEKERIIDKDEGMIPPIEENTF